MPDSTLDLWPPDIYEPPSVTPPALILKRQAGLLGQKTNNLIEASVHTTSESRGFRHEFSVSVPTLGGYRYALFSVQHGLQPYPVKAIMLPDTRDAELCTEEEFVEWLRTTLSSPETKRVISSLLALVKS